MKNRKQMRSIKGHRLLRWKKKRQESEKENAEKQEESDTDIKETEAVQAKVENPLDQIKKIKSMGILGLVLKDGTVVSDKTIERKNLPSERNLQKVHFLSMKFLRIQFQKPFFELSSETFPVCS